jgi:predicted nucleotidyltransferase
MERLSPSSFSRLARALRSGPKARFEKKIKNNFFFREIGVVLGFFLRGKSQKFRGLSKKKAPRVHKKKLLSLGKKGSGPKKMQVHKMDDAMSVTDLKLFGSSHRGTMLPERDVALLLQRVRKMDPPRAVQSQSRVEEIITPRPSPKAAEKLRLNPHAWPRASWRALSRAECPLRPQRVH